MWKESENAGYQHFFLSFNVSKAFFTVVKTCKCGKESLPKWQNFRLVKIESI